MGIAWHMITEHKLQKLVTFTAILVAKSFFYSPWQPKWLRLGALIVTNYYFCCSIFLDTILQPTSTIEPAFEDLYHVDE